MRPKNSKVDRPDQLEAGREDRLAAGARDGDVAVLERLAERLERGPRELRELVEEEHAVVREARLPGSRPGPAADDRRRRGAVVRRPERRPRHEWMPRLEQPGHRVDARDLERLLVGEGR